MAIVVSSYAREDVETLMIGYESMRVDPPRAFYHSQFIANPIWPDSCFGLHVSV